MYTNQESLNQSEYGDEEIKRESIILRYYTSSKTPSYFYQYIESNELNDSTDYLQLSSYEQKPFFTNKKDNVNILSSTWNTFPTKENPNNRFKFLSFYLIRDPDLHKIYRKTNGIIDVLAEVGGLMRALIFFGN